MPDSNIQNLDRSVAEFQVTYNSGVHTIGRKKGQENSVVETITIIVLSLDENYVQNYIREYCRKKSMQLVKFEINPLPHRCFLTKASHNRIQAIST